MEFRQIEAFVNAVKYKSFSKAADATFLTQPTISAHLSNLESELGIVLLNRSGREITLTKQGETFYPYAVDMLNTRSQALYSVQQLSKTMDGVLDVHASTIPGQYYLPALMTKFHRKHPKVRFYVEQSDSKKVMDHIVAQKGEIGLVGCKMNNSLVYEPLFMDETVLMVPDTGRFEGWESGSTVDFEDFKKEMFILREEGSGTKKEMEKAQIRGVAVFKDIHVIARMNNLEAIRQAVSAGLGISIVSRKAAEDKASQNRVKYFRIDGLEKKRTFYLVYNKNICLSPEADAFCHMALEYRDANWERDLGSFIQPEDAAWQS